VEDARTRRDFVAQLAKPEAQLLVERLFLTNVVAFDWNYPKHVTLRYTDAEFDEMISPLTARIAELEASTTPHRSE